MQRRAFLHTTLNSLASASVLSSLPAVTLSAAEPVIDLPAPPAETDPLTLAADDDWWETTIGRFYDRTEGTINLEHGYWGKMANPVKDFYLAATDRINRQSAFYAREQYGDDLRANIHSVAAALDVQDNEIALTRNATEGFHGLIRQYTDLSPGDKVLFADSDYPDYKNGMRWLESARGVGLVEVQIPAQANQEDLLAVYVAAFAANPELKLMLLTHVSNQHGLVFPVKAIAAEAKARGIDVICDAAQSWGLVDFTVPDLDVDWAVFNVHKWIGSPVGVGALYMREGSLEKIDVFPGDEDPDSTRVTTRIHTATANFAAMVSVAPALAFHRAVGGMAKQERLKYLRNLWALPAAEMPHIEVVGGSDHDSISGMGGFRLKDQATPGEVQALQQRLEDAGIYTVARIGLNTGACIRVTPQVYTKRSEIAAFVEVLQGLA